MQMAAAIPSASIARSNCSALLCGTKNDPVRRDADGHRRGAGYTGWKRRATLVGHTRTSAISRRRLVARNEAFFFLGDVRVEHRSIGTSGSLTGKKEPKMRR